MFRISPLVGAALFAAWTLSNLGLLSSASAQNVRTFDNGNNEFLQSSGDPSVMGVTFNFLGGDDNLVLLRNDDLAGLDGLVSGVANMGPGRDKVIASFNMSGTFNLGEDDDIFACEGDRSFNGNTVDIRVACGGGADVVYVTTDFCQYSGEEGDDIFVSDVSRNTFDGGPGRDTYSAELAENAVSIDLAAGQALGRFSTPETLVGIENAKGGGFADTIAGDADANRLDGLDGNDSIDGKRGNDTISGGSGIDSLNGDLGVDTLVVAGTVGSRSRLSATTVVVTGVSEGKSFSHTASNFEQVFDNGTLKSIGFFMGEAVSSVVLPTFIPEAVIAPQPTPAPSPTPVPAAAPTVKLLPAKRTVSAGKSATFIVVVTADAMTPQSVPVSFVSSNPAVSAPGQVTISVPAKKKATQKAKSARQKVKVQIPPGASGAAVITASVLGGSPSTCNLTIKPGRN